MAKTRTFQATFEDGLTCTATLPKKALRNGRMNELELKWRPFEPPTLPAGFHEFAADIFQTVANVSGKIIQGIGAGNMMTTYRPRKGATR